jgi:hypothetical protein
MKAFEDPRKDPKNVCHFGSGGSTNDLVVKEAGCSSWGSEETGHRLE